MPEGYTRSRSKFSGSYSGNSDNSSDPRGSGGNATQSVVIIVVIIVIVGILGFLFKDKIASVFGGGTAIPTDTPVQTTMASDTPAPTATSEPTSSDLVTPASTDTQQPSDSTTPAPTDTQQPGDTTTPALADTQQPGDSASPAPTDTQQPSDSPTPAATTPKTIAIKPVIGKANVTSYLPLRSTASSTASILVKIPKDATFTVTQVSTSATWLKVKYSGNTGYVLAKYVTIGTSDTNKVCTITSTSLNVRSGAGKTHAIIGVLKAGNTVVVTKQVTSTDGTWYKVVAGKSTGYIDAQYCRLSTN